jgi:hypothetical protein
VDAGNEEDAGPHDAGEPRDAGEPVDAGHSLDGGASVGASVDLFQESGTVPNGFGGTIQVQLLVPFVTVWNGPLPVNDYDDRVNGLGCYANHYDSTHPRPQDANAGTFTISGYHAASFLTGGSAPSSITCAVSSGNYSCSYRGQSSAAATQAYSSTTNPLGSGPITFSAASNAILGSVDLQDSPDGTVTVSQNLNALTYSANSDMTLSYSCNGACSSSAVIIISIAATDNAVGSTSTSSATSGAITCVELGGSSVTIPKAAVAAMLDNDNQLMSVFTSVVNAHGAGMAVGAQANAVTALVGSGVFGISSL